MLRLIPTTAILSGVLATTAVAALLCEKKSGAIFVRPSGCKKKETAIDPAALGLQGPPGAKGDVGAPGTPGAPGTAVAYAHVNADGTVDAANSKNVTSANVSLDTLVVSS
ncbi:MAG TPA: collagen-like protein, partial [Candidatus Binatia bacterium]|nr:collagen-like protein [Candidatus Binatia bacterium]